MFKKYFFIVSSLSFVLGLFLSFYLEIFRKYSVLLFFILFLFFLLLLIKKQRIYLIIPVFLFLGIWRYEILINSELSGEIKKHYNEDLIIIGKVIAEPEIKASSQKIKIEIYQAKDSQENFLNLNEKILVITQPHPIYSFSDFLEIKGEYIEPGLIDNFDYGLYLKRFGLGAVSYYPEIKKIDKSKDEILFSFLKSKIYILKNKFREIFDYNLDFTSSSILKAMILGDKFFLTSDIRESFSRSGLSHIIAISGLHITLLASLFLSFLLFLGISRRQAFYFNILFLFFYLMLIGAPASACRASIMGFLSFLSIYLGRSGNISNALFLVGLILLFVNPLLIFADIGFQLSFLAVLGIIYIHPIIKEFLTNKIFRKFLIMENILDIISITISVQLISAPILISNFNQVSLIAPLSNLLVLWTIPIIISFSIVAIIIFFICPFLSQIIFFLVEIILRYIVFINDVINKIPGAFISVSRIIIFWIIIYYLFLFYIFILKKQKPV
jgi:competence protein ComEC